MGSAVPARLLNHSACDHVLGASSWENALKQPSIHSLWPVKAHFLEQNSYLQVYHSVNQMGPASSDPESVILYEKTQAL